MLLGYIARRLRLTTDADPFTPLERADWNNDSAVVRHELGHAVVWFHHGGELRYLRCTRAPDRLLEAGVQPDPATPEQMKQRSYIDALAERLLAGEAAARIHLGVPGGRIGLRGLHGNRMAAGIRPREIASTMTGDGIAPNGRLQLEDATKVLSLAHDYHRCRWRRWIRARLARAEALVHEYMHVIDAVAIQIERRLPVRPGESLVIESAELVDCLLRNGAVTRSRAAVPPRR